METLADLIGHCVEKEPEGDQLRDCILNSLPQEEGDCPMRAILIAQDGCPACERAEEQLAGLPIKRVTPEEVGEEKVEFTPQLWVIDCNGEKLLELELD